MSSAASAVANFVHTEFVRATKADSPIVVLVESSVTGSAVGFGDTGIAVVAAVGSGTEELPAVAGRRPCPFQPCPFQPCPFQPCPSPGWLSVRRDCGWMPRRPARSDESEERNAHQDQRTVLNCRRAIHLLSVHWSRRTERTTIVPAPMASRQCVFSPAMPRRRDMAPRYGVGRRALRSGVLRHASGAARCVPTP